MFGNSSLASGNVYVFDGSGALLSTVAVSALTPISGVQMYADGLKFTIYANNGWFKTYAVSGGALLGSGSIPGFA